MRSQICAVAASLSVLYSSPPHLSKSLNSVIFIAQDEKNSNRSLIPSPLGLMALGMETVHSSSHSPPSTTSILPTNSQSADRIKKGYRPGISTTKPPESAPSSHPNSHSLW